MMQDSDTIFFLSARLDCAKKPYLDDWRGRKWHQTMTPCSLLVVSVLVKAHCQMLMLAMPAVESPLFCAIGYGTLCPWVDISSHLSFCVSSGLSMIKYMW